MNYSSYAQSFLTTTELSKLKNNYKINDNYIGGMYNNEPHFNRDLGSYDYKIKDSKTFFKLLENEDLRGKKVYLMGDFDIDFSGKKNILFPEGLTLFGDRGKHLSKGVRLLTKLAGTNPLFIVENNVTILGLRIEGPDKEVFHNGFEYKGENSLNLNRYKNPVSTGMKLKGSNITIENCEFLGWTYSAVLVGKGSDSNNIRFSYFHHNRRYGLGYGITVDGGYVSVYANIFDFNRHDIAGTGKEGSGYDVYLNIFLSHTTSHNVDMHGGKDRKDLTDIAGDFLNVYNNYFEKEDINDKIFLLRGKPQNMSYFRNNYIKILNSKSKPINRRVQYQQVNAKGNIVFEDNFVNN